LSENFSAETEIARIVTKTILTNCRRAAHDWYKVYRAEVTGG
jgi:hypothetical protein